MCRYARWVPGYVRVHLLQLHRAGLQGHAKHQEYTRINKDPRDVYFPVKWYFCPKTFFRNDTVKLPLFPRFSTTSPFLINQNIFLQLTNNSNPPWGGGGGWKYTPLTDPPNIIRMGHDSSTPCYSYSNFLNLLWVYPVWDCRYCKTKTSFCNICTGWPKKNSD